MVVLSEDDDGRERGRLRRVLTRGKGMPCVALDEYSIFLRSKQGRTFLELDRAFTFLSR